MKITTITTTSLFLFLLLLFLPTNSLTNPLSWLPRPDIQANNFILIDVNNSISATTYTLTLNGFFTMIPVTAFGIEHLISGIVGFEFPAPTSFSFSCVEASPSPGSVEFTCTIDSGTTINYMKVSALTVGFTVTGMQVLSGTKIFTTLSSGTTVRTETFTEPITSVYGLVNIKFVPFLTGITMDTGSFANYIFSLQIQQDINNLNNYQIVFTAGENVTATSATYTAILCDYAGLDPKSQLDVTFGTYTMGITNYPFFPLTKNVSLNFMAGLNSFDFTSSSQMMFTIDFADHSIISHFFPLLNVSAVQYRAWNCDPSTPYAIVVMEMCYDVCPGGYYGDTMLVTCEACWPTCETCTGAGIDNCLTCWAWSFRTQQGGRCECVGLGVYDAGVNICGTCSYTCETCTESASYCLSCGSGTHRTFAGNNCACEPYYADNSTAICASCSALISGCIKCSSKTVCTACNTAGNWVLSAGKCNCTTGFYKSSFGVCSPCSYTCKTCNLISQNCTACPASSFRTLDQSLTTWSCPCNTNYLDNSTASCVPCSSFLPGCAACTLSTLCDTCNTANFFQPSGNGCECISKYYLSGSACLPCDVQCEECDTLSSNCTTCPAVAHRTPNGNTCPCDYGYVEDGTVVCQKCDVAVIGCVECVAVGVCVLCDSTKGFYLNSMDDKCYCPVKFYVDNTGKCEPCEMRCEECSVLATNCTSCPGGVHRTLTGQACPCDNGFTDDGTVECKACSTTMTGCLECSSLVTCTLCDTANYFVFNTGDDKCYCPLDRYLTNLDVCAQCSVSCQQCSVLATNCTSCPSASHRTLIGQSCPCDNGFADDNTAICKPCNTIMVGCLQCPSLTTCTLCDTANTFSLNPSTNQCSCPSNHHLTSTNTCSLCSITCQQCSLISTNCTSCPVSSHRTLTSQACPCDTGYVHDGTYLCKTCNTFMKGCLECSDVSTCTLCDTAKNFQIDTDDKCYCQTHYYLVAVAAVDTCKICAITCLDCSVLAANCTSCPVGANRTQAGNACPCDAGFGEDGTVVCKACDTYLVGCLQCAVVTVCTGCDTGNNFTLNAIDNKCNCLPSHYLTNTNVCAQCLITCQQCHTLPNNCTSCPLSSFRTLTSNTCPCDYGYISDSTPICKPCSTIPGCLNCSSLSICTTCHTVGNFLLNTGDDQCYCLSHYFLTTINTCQLCSITCQECDTVSTNCTSCPVSSNRNLVGNVCECDVAFGEDGTAVCKACSIGLVGCVECAVVTQCMVCDTGNNFTLNTVDNKCKCLPNHYLTNTNVCAQCSITCQQCHTISTNCTSCPVSSFRTLTSNACPCDSHYIHDGTAICKNCNTNIKGCLFCSDLSTCTTCDTANNFTLNTGDNQCYCLARHYLTNLDVCAQCSYTCLECDVFSTNCTSCVSGSFRTLAVDKCPCDTGYADNGTQTCVTCGSVLTGCLQCTSNTLCTLCDTPNFFSLSSGTCQCNTGYYLNSTSCLTCNTTLTHLCLSCTSSTACTQCLSPWTVSSGVCICPTGYLIDSLGNCSVCGILCASCDGSGCVTCITGYQIVGVGRCEEVCGDGKVFVYECDDGNNQDGDGCSKECKVEEGFKCVNGTMTTPSVCSYNGSLVFTLQRIFKELTANRVDFVILIRPALKILRNWNFSQVVKVIIQRRKVSSSSGNPNTTPTVSATTDTAPISTQLSYSEDGTLLAQVSYSESIQDLPATLSFTPPTTSASFAMQSTSVAFTVDPANLDAYYLEPTTYELVSGMEMVYKGTLGIAVVMTVISLFVAPIIGLEMMNVMQMAFFAVGMLGTAQPVLASLGELYPVVNGYNRLFDVVEDRLDMNAVTLTKMLNQIRAGPRFVVNFNYMLFVELFLAGLTALFVYLRTKFNDNKGIAVFAKALSSLTVSFVAFNSLNFGFSVGMDFAYISQPNYNAPRVILNIVGWVVGGAVQILLCVCLRKYPQLLPFPNEKAIKPHVNVSTYFIAFTAYRSVIGLIMGGFHRLQPSALLLGLQMTLLGCLLYLRPYANWLLNFRMALNELAICLIFVSTTLYTYVLTGDALSENGPIIAQTVLIATSIAFSAISIARAIFQKPSKISSLQPKQRSDIIVHPNQLCQKPRKLSSHQPIPADTSNLNLMPPENSVRNTHSDNTIATILDDQVTQDPPKRKQRPPKKLKKIRMREEEEERDVEVIGGGDKQQQEEL